MRKGKHIQVFIACNLSTKAYLPLQYTSNKINLMSDPAKVHTVSMHRARTLKDTLNWLPHININAPGLW